MKHLAGVVSSSSLFSCARTCIHTPTEYMYIRTRFHFFQKILNLDSAPVLPGLYQPPVPAVGSNTLPLVSGSAATTINWQSATVNSTTG